MSKAPTADDHVPVIQAVHFEVPDDDHVPLEQFRQADKTLAPQRVENVPALQLMQSKAAVAPKSEDHDPSLQD